MRERLTKIGMRFEAAYVILAVLLLSSMSLIPRPAHPYVAIVVALLFGWAFIYRQIMTSHLLLLAFPCFLFSNLWPSGTPFFFLVPLLTYAAMTRGIPRLRRSLHWLRKGTWNSGVVWLVLATVVVSSAALYAWCILLHPSLTEWRNAIPTQNPAMLALTGIGFATLNAAIDESIFRGIVMNALEAVLGRGIVSLVIQSVSFGMVHLYGIPSGWIGVAMASIYGFMLGLVQRHSNGLLAPFSAHVAGDLVIFVMVATWL